jgi:hypothetical protein
MGSEAKIKTTSEIFVWLLLFGAVLFLFLIGCAEIDRDNSPTIIIITTWESSDAPEIKIVYKNHYKRNNSSPEIELKNSKEVAAYRKQLQRALDELTKIEDYMHQKEEETKVEYTPHEGD